MERHLDEQLLAPRSPALDLAVDVGHEREQRSHELLFERAPSDDRGQLGLDQAHVLGEHLAEVRREGLRTAGRAPAAGEALDPLLG